MLEIVDKWKPYDRSTDGQECNPQGFRRIGPSGGGRNGYPAGVILLPDKSASTTPTYYARPQKHCRRKDSCEAIGRRHFGAQAALIDWSSLTAAAMREAAIFANTGKIPERAKLAPATRPKQKSVPKHVIRPVPECDFPLAFNPQLCPLETHGLMHAGMAR